MAFLKKKLIKKIKEASLAGDDELLFQLITEAFPCSNEKTESKLADDDLLSQFITQVFSDINRTTKLKLDNKADLTSLLPLAFITMGIIEVMRRPSMPKWNELMWYGYSLFRDVNEDKCRVPHFHTKRSKE